MHRSDVSLDPFAVAMSTARQATAPTPKQGQGILDADPVVHVRTTEHREKTATTSWRGPVTFPQVRYSCSCGWTIGWHRDLTRAWRRAQAHALGGQQSWNFGA